LSHVVQATIIPNKWEVERPGMGGDLAVKVNGTVLVTIHYDYRYISNAVQWNLAEKIVKILGGKLK
jgi:hypothetical protein